jgi:hypothetical protein
LIDDDNPTPESPRSRPVRAAKRSHQRAFLAVDHAHQKELPALAHLSNIPKAPITRMAISEMAMNTGTILLR